MHIPAKHAISSPPLLISFLRSYPLGLLITSYPPPPPARPAPGKPLAAAAEEEVEAEEELQASHIPWVVDVPPELEPQIAAARAEWDEGVALARTAGGVGDTAGGVQEERLADEAWKGKVKMRAHAARLNPQMRAVLHHIKEKEKERERAKEQETQRAQEGDEAKKGRGWWPFSASFPSRARAVEPNSDSGFASASTSTSASTGARASDAPYTLERNVLLMFTLPETAYISPSWYKGTKPVEGKVVPTWDYAAIQVYGKLTVYHAPPARASASADDSGEHGDTPSIRPPVTAESSSAGLLGSTSAFLQNAISALTDQEEAKLLRPSEGPGNGDKDGVGHKRHWRLTDAPQAYLEAHKRPIIGLELEVERLEGRWKMSQDKGPADYAGVREGLRGCPMYHARGEGGGDGATTGAARRDGVVDGVEKAGKRWGQGV